MSREPLGKLFTSHTSNFILSLLQILLGQFQIKIELNLCFIQVSKPSLEHARSLQSVDNQSTGTNIWLLLSDKIQVQFVMAKRVLRLLLNHTFNSSLRDYT